MEPIKIEQLKALLEEVKNRPMAAHADISTKVITKKSDGKVGNAQEILCTYGPYGEDLMLVLEAVVPNEIIDIIAKFIGNEIASLMAKYCPVTKVE